LSCYGFGQVTPDSHENVPMERTVTMHEKPILPREPNGRRARDLFSNATLDDQISWVKGRVSDVNNPILSTRQRQAAHLQLGHCLEKDREHKLPANLRLEAQRIVEDPLRNLKKKTPNHLTPLSLSLQRKQACPASEGRAHASSQGQVQGVTK
jgi:hypothetical protein